MQSGAVLTAPFPTQLAAAADAGASFSARQREPTRNLMIQRSSGECDCNVLLIFNMLNFGFNAVM